MNIVDLTQRVQVRTKSAFEDHETKLNGKIHESELLAIKLVPLVLRQVAGLANQAIGMTLREEPLAELEPLFADLDVEGILVEAPS